MQRNGVMAAVLRIHQFYSKAPYLNASIQLAVAKVMTQLLDCNFSRPALIDPDSPSGEDADPVSICTAAFRIAHSHMLSKDHVDKGCRCLAQCCRSERGRLHILSHNYLPYIAQFCKKYMGDPSIVRSSLRVLHWVSTDLTRLEEACRHKAVCLALAAIRRHGDQRPVVGVAAALLARAGSSLPSAMKAILHKQAVPDVIHALRLVYDDLAVQKELLLLLQTLSRTSEGFRQIDSTRGGWQTVCQGTPLGDALLHRLPGALFNEGWCLGESSLILCGGREAMSGFDSFT